MKTSTTKLKHYRWKGINSSGKKVYGQILALDELEVRGKLQDQHIELRRVKKAVFLSSLTSLIVLKLKTLPC